MWTADFIVVKYFAFDLCRPSYPPFYKQTAAETNVVHNFKMFQSEPLRLCQNVSFFKVTISYIIHMTFFNIRDFQS